MHRSPECIYHTAESLQVLINIFFFPNPKSLVTSTLPYFTWVHISKKRALHIREIMQDPPHCVRLTSLSTMSSWCIRVSPMAALPASYGWRVFPSVPRHHVTFIHRSLMDTQVVSMSLLLWMSLQWTWECRCLFEILIPCPLNRHSQRKCWTLWKF